MNKLLVENRYFVVPFMIASFCGLLYISLYSTTEGHVLINVYHNDFFDLFFKYITYLGDGLMFGVVILFGIFIRYRISLYAVIVGVLVLLVINVIGKELLFHDWDRPSLVFHNLGQQLHYISGVKNHKHNTFPSGHATTAFGVFALMAFFSKKNYIKVFFVSLAIIASFSRVYLSQHFVRDITVGGIIGFGIAFFVFYFLNEKMKYNTKIDGSLFKNIIKKQAGDSE